MTIQEQRNMLAAFDKVRVQLEAVGLSVHEIDDCSDRPYYFIGAEDPSKHHGMPWAFTAPDIGEFVRLAEIYLAGMKKAAGGGLSLRAPPPANRAGRPTARNKGSRVGRSHHHDPAKIGG